MALFADLKFALRYTQSFLHHSTGCRHLEGLLFGTQDAQIATLTGRIQNCARNVRTKPTRRTKLDQDRDGIQNSTRTKSFSRENSKKSDLCRICTKTRREDNVQH